MQHLLTGLLLFSAVLSARAELVVVESLEWSTVRAPLVVRGKVLDVKDGYDKAEERSYQDVTIAITEKYKGPHEGKTVTIRMLAGVHNFTGEEWKKTEHEYLFFLSRENPYKRKALEGRWQSQQPPVDLDAEPKLYSSKLKYIEGPREALDIVRKYATLQTPGEEGGKGDPTKRGIVSLVISAPHDSPLYDDLNSRSGVLITIPADEEYRQHLLKLIKSKDLWERKTAAHQIQAYPGTETVKLLREMLRDSETTEVMDVKGDSSEMFYPVRLSAYDSLMKLGEKPEMPVISRPLTPEEAQKAKRRRNENNPN